VIVALGDAAVMGGCWWLSGQIAKGRGPTNGKTSDRTGAARPATDILAQNASYLTWMRTLVLFSLRMR
jgi:hypothetical protein